MTADGDPGAVERERAQRRVLYLAASLRSRGFLPDPIVVVPGAPPPIEYLPRFVTLVRLLAHGDRLLDDVLPAILQRLSFSSTRQREAHPHYVRGSMDWQATYRDAWRHGQVTPATLLSRRPWRIYATPENLLAAQTLVCVRRDVSRLLGERRTYLHDEEAARLRSLAGRLERSLRVPQLGELASTLPPPLGEGMETDAARRLEQEVRRRVGQDHRLRAYLALLDWRRTWRAYLTEAAGEVLSLPFWKLTDDELYELMVLLELVSTFSAHGERARQTRGRRGAGDPVFELRLRDGRDLAIWFQSAQGLESFTEVTGRPDLVIRIGSRTVIADAKHYRRARDYTEALYKLMGYLYSFGYPDRWAAIDGAAVVFPNPDPERHPGFRLLARTRPGRQWLASLIIPFSGADGAAAEWLRAFTNHLLG
jgi:hypothetical protein